MADDTTVTRAALLTRLRTACVTLGTSPAAFFARRAWHVGAFPPGRPLPRVEELPAGQLADLVGMAEQAVRLGGKCARTDSNEEPA